MAQIHELNTFAGTLGAGAYLAIDDGTDTGKISSQGLLAATEARIDNIIAGPAPSAEEIVDARLGDDGVVYPSLGDAIRDQFSDVKSAFIKLFELEAFNKFDLDGTGSFIQNNQNVGEVCPLTPTSYSNYGYIIFRDVPKDVVFSVTGSTHGAGRARLWSWLNPNGTLISKEGTTSDEITVDLTCPVEGATLVVNFHTGKNYDVKVKNFYSPEETSRLFTALYEHMHIEDSSDYMPIMCEFEQGRYQQGVKNGINYNTACRTISKIKTADCDYMLINRTDKKYAVYVAYFDANGDFVTQTAGQQIQRYSFDKSYDSFALTVIDYTGSVFTNVIRPKQCYENIVLCKQNDYKIAEVQNITSILGNDGCSVISADFENGRIDADGLNKDDNNYAWRARTIGFYSTSDIDYVINTRSKDYLVYFHYYDANKDFVVQDPATGQSAHINTINKNYAYFRLTVLNYDGQSYTNVITPTEVKSNIFLAKSTMLSQVLGNVNADFGGLVPTYFNGNLVSAKANIRAHKGLCGRYGTSFIFATDLHWGHNEKHSPALIHYINNNCMVQNLVLGGDYIDQYANKQTAIDTMYWCLSRYFKLMYNVFPMYGNHDSNSNGTTSESYMTDGETFSIINQWMNNGIVYGNNYFDFYWDEEKTNTRYILVDTGAQSIDGGVISETTFEWLNTILNTDKNIVVFAHWLFSPTTWNHPLVDGELVGSYTASATRLFSALDAINANGGKVQAIITGHLHCDYDDKTSGGIPIVWTDTDSTIALGEYSATAGTVSEQCFDIMTIDYTDKKIYCDRVGRGISRVISY